MKYDEATLKADWELAGDRLKCESKRIGVKLSENIWLNMKRVQITPLGY